MTTPVAHAGNAHDGGCRAGRARTGIALPIVALLLCALTAWRHADVLRQGGTGVFSQVSSHLERSDQLLHAWILDWNYHTLPRDPLALFHANAFYPHPFSLALSDHLFGVAVTLAPLRAFVSNPLRLNALGTLATFVLAGTAVAGLVWFLTGSIAGACVAAVLYAFNPFRQSNYAQIQLLADYAIPLSFLFLHRYERDGRSRDLVAMAASVAWQTLCSAYLGAYLAFILGIVLAGRVWRRPQLRNWGGFVLAAIVGAAMLAPFLYPYAWLRAHGQLHQHEINTIALSLAVKDLICWPECRSFFGPLLAPAAVLLGGAALWPPARASAGTYVAVAIMGAVLSLGPYVHTSSIGDLDAAPGFVFPGPYWPLQRWAPGFDGFRVPGRFIVFGNFALSVLAGLGTARLVAARADIIVRGLVAAAALTVAVLTLTRPQMTFEPLPAGDDAAEVYRWLADEPAREPIVEFPLGPYDDFIMYHSRLHRHPIVNGYSGFLPFSHRHIAAALRCYPCPAALRALRDLNVRTHLVHLNLMANPRRAAIQGQIAATPSLTVVRRFGDTLVVSLATAPAEPESPAASPVPLDRRAWHVTSSRGPRGTERAVDASRETAWSTGLDLEDLQRPVAGLRLLQRPGTWREFLELIPRGSEWFAVDLGGVHAVRRLSLAFSDLAGGLQAPPTPAPTVQGSLDGVQWFDLPSDAVVRPSLRDLDRNLVETRFEYDWPATRVRHLRLTYRGFWYLRDVAVFG
jgi:hypothetical protein